MRTKINERVNMSLLLGELPRIVAAIPSGCADSTMQMARVEPYKDYIADEPPRGNVSSDDISKACSGA
jgi:hypothetical protein